MQLHYFDKHGVEIKPGMIIRHDDGDTEEVYATEDSFGNDSLGIMASNPEYLKRHPDAKIEYYSLSNFDMSEWEIIGEAK